MSLLDVEALSVRYDGAAVVDQLTFSIDSGETLGVVGESGSGKTQTALALLGLLPETADVSGSARFGGRELLGASERELDRVRAMELSMVFQDPSLALNPYLRVGAQLRRILIAHGLADGRRADARVIDMLKSVGLPDAERQSRAYPHQLSGGMRQRVMIASALITKPKLLIADEPTTALDVTVQLQILELLNAIREDTALLLITHDLGIVAGHCERILVLADGSFVESGATAKVFAAPAEAHTAKLLLAAPRLSHDSAPPPVSAEPLLTVNAAAVRYREPGHGWLHAVRNVDLALRQGETLAIVGESGSGKSSLARAVLGLVEAAHGEISFQGIPLALDVRDRPKSIRRELQLVYQDPIGSLNPQMRVEDIVAEPLSVHERKLDKQSRRERIIAMLAQVGLGEDFLHRYPHELSGGQGQRVAIARALILSPKVLVCDEAMAALDGTVRERILVLLQQIQARTGLSILFISHDLGVVNAISHRVLVMYLGRLVEAADSRVLFTAPKHPYTRALIDAVPLPDPFCKNESQPLSGEVPSPLTPPSGCAFHPRCRFTIERCKAELPKARDVDATTVSCHRAEDIDSLR